MRTQEPGSKTEPLPPGIPQDITGPSVSRIGNVNNRSLHKSVKDAALEALPSIFCWPPGKLAFGVWILGLPQFDRISFGVVYAGEPAYGIIRGNLDFDSRSL